MNYTEMRSLLRQRPFRPFRVHLNDERTFDVLYPEMNIVTQSTLVIGVPVPDDPNPVADRFISVPLAIVSRVEPLSEAASTPTSP